MENQPLVSVIITTYRREMDLLMEAVNSVIHQSYRPIEIILIDDNGEGTEHQKQNQQQFSSDESVRYFANKQNSGAQYSRNRGIFEAKGEFLAFLDDDDVWVQDKLQEQSIYFSDPTVGLIGCNGYIFYDSDFEKTTVYNQNDAVNHPIGFQEMLAADCLGTTTQAVIRKESILKAGLFDYFMPARQDYDMWLRISEHWQIRYVNKPLFYHRLHAGEQISKNGNKAYAGYQRILHKYQDKYRKNRLARAKMHMKLSLSAYRCKRIPKAMSHMLKAFFSHPICTMKTVLRHSSNQK
ncbi:MAG: glycosyltransferase [Oscillospiraceae bacterium]|nr:glycosyltransferase [Oscillospiraceae bacterium]